jgi:hypothetical protein
VVVLEFMFPNDSFDVTPFRPLDYRTFREKVLLPEIETILIQQDLPQLDRADAIRTLHTSQEFSTLLHPGTNSYHVDDAIRRVTSRNKIVGEGRVMKKEDENIEVGESCAEFIEVLENSKVVILLDD